VLYQLSYKGGVAAIAYTDIQSIYFYQELVKFAYV
jgi:hypothetical protein